MSVMIVLNRVELLTVLRLVEWRCADHSAVMRECAPSGAIDDQHEERYQTAVEQLEALRPLERKLREAEERSRPPIEGETFHGIPVGK